jgi:hypothetical protein
MAGLRLEATLLGFAMNYPPAFVYRFCARRRDPA